MKQKMTWIKTILCSILFLGNVVAAHAEVEPPYSVSNNDGIKYVCESDAYNTVDLNNVVGAVLTNQGGYWDQVDFEGNVIAAKVGNVFNLTGKLVGTYYFRYTATNNACLPVGQTKVACVVIVPVAVDFSHIVYSCTGETPTLDLAKILPPSLSGATITYSLNGAPTGVSIAGSVLSMTNYMGTFEVTYNVGRTDAEAAAACDSEGTITIEVIRDNDNPTLTVEEITYCLSSLPKSINLSQLAGATMYENAEWSTTNTNGSLDENTFTFAQPVVLGDYVFTYAWEGTSCYPAASGTLTVKVVEEELNLPTGPLTENICKAENPSRVYNLTLEALHMSLPQSAGKWELDDAPIGYDVDVTDGLFEVAKAAVGTYKLIYTAYDVAKLCGLTGSVELTMNIGDNSSSAYDGRVQLCALDLASKPGSLKLSDYVLDMPAGAKWKDQSGTLMASDEVTYLDLDALGVGTYEYTFEYASVGCTGNGTGSLYVTITNNLDLPEELTLAFCRPDMPSSINMNQVIGAAIDGTWTLESTNPAVKPGNLDGAMFNETALLGDGPITYVLKFTPDETKTECAVPAEITVTIKVDDEEF